MIRESELRRMMLQDELYHTGRKGMKWYQHIFTSRYYNKDGTLTAAGKKRAEKYRSKYLKMTGKKQLRGDNAKNKQSSQTEKSVSDKIVKSKKMKDMTNDELDAAISRMKKEIEFSEKYKSLNPQKVSVGKTFVNKVLLPATTDAGKRALTDYMEKQMKKALGVPITSNNSKKKNK